MSRKRPVDCELRSTSQMVMHGSVAGVCSGNICVLFTVPEMGTALVLGK